MEQDEEQSIESKNDSVLLLRLFGFDVEGAALDFDEGAADVFAEDAK